MQVLVLAETEMIPWKPDVRRVMGNVLGTGLELRQGGSEAQAAFCSQVRHACSSPAEPLCWPQAYRVAALQFVDAA